MRHPLLRFLMVLGVASVLSVVAPGGIRADDHPAKDKPADPKVAPHDPAPAAANPREKHPWGRFKAGSWVKTKSTTKNEVENASGGGVPATEMVSEIKSTLKEIRENTYVLDMEMTSFGNTQTMPMEYSFLENPAGTEPPKVLEEKDEDVKAAGETWACHYTRTEGAGMQGQETIETWKCDKAPGGVVKKSTVSDQAGQKVTTLLTLEKKEEKLDVAGQKLTCWVMKNVFDAPPNNTSTATLWFSEEVPGLLVKMESVSKASASKTETTMLVTGFEAKK